VAADDAEDVADAVRWAADHRMPVAVQATGRALRAAGPGTGAPDPAPLVRPAWSWLQEVTVGFGYRPLRATAWLALFLALGTLVFGLHHPPALPGTAHPAFNPFVYTVDLLVPLVGLGLRNSYDPQGPQRWLAYLLIAVGWVFVTTIAAGVLRVLRRQ
jgi:hypothetical protein